MNKAAIARAVLGTQGPTALVAHRCHEHRNLAPINDQGDLLVMYAAEKRPAAYPLGRGGNGEQIHAECGGCLATDTEELYQVALDLLDTIADLLRSRAELRAEKARMERFL